MAGNNLGPLIRLWGIKTDQLPTGPLLRGADKGEDKSADGVGVGNDVGGGGGGHIDVGSTGSTEELTVFLGSLLREAVPFIDSVVVPGRSGDGDGDDTRAESIWKPKGSKTFTIPGSSSSPSSSSSSSSGKVKVEVELFERVIETKELEEAASAGASRSGKTPTITGNETWICRRSVHEDKKEKGTASWAEFRDCFKERHPETEALFTPSVVRMDKRVVWDCNGVPSQKIGNETYSNFTLCILEARHKVGKPLRDRTFPILQMTCAAMDTEITTNTARQEPKEKRDFLVISVTIPDYFESKFSGPKSSSGGGDKTESKSDLDNDTVIASYASIERIRQLPNKTLDGEVNTNTGSTDKAKEDGKIEWLMALTSDAGGILPRWIQNLAVPGQIAKDVPLFLVWIGKERAKK